MDFGIARGAESMLTATGTIMGTPAYMAPEILAGRQYSVRSDVYAAGVLIYEMLARRNPYLGQSVAATLHNTLHLCPDHLCRVRPDIPAELGDAVMACLEKDPARRPESLGPLLGTIQRLPQPGQAPSLDTHSVVNLHDPWRERRRRARPASCGAREGSTGPAGVAPRGGDRRHAVGGDRRIGRSSAGGVKRGVGSTPTVPTASPLAVLQPSRVDHSPSPTPGAQAPHRAAPSPSGLRAPARGDEQSRLTPAPNPPPRR